jgi:glucosamine--fructose-6-phosphate aminotransferase (isomerizing)
MCGIIGYIGQRQVQDVLLQGLSRLEYRGYDSAGIALHTGDEVVTRKAVGNLAMLRRAMDEPGLPGDVVSTATLAVSAGIGHTRWATHGGVTEANAHPHSDCTGRVHVVLNGIVENHHDLRSRLEGDGCGFTSETDAEPIAHLVERRLEDVDDLHEAVRLAVLDLEGHFAIVVLDREHPRTLIAARKECPLVLGLGDGETFVASAAAAFREFTDRTVVLGDGQMAHVTPDGVRLSDAVTGERRPAMVQRILWLADDVDKGRYSTFMRKEIDDQPAGFAATIDHYSAPGREFSLGDAERTLAGARRLVIVACGTSYHAGLLGKHFLHAWAGMPAAVEIASEWRYAEPVLEPGDVVLAISQSGETRDTLAALRLAAERGVPTIALTNVEGSQICELAEWTLLTQAGPEIGVAATKTFTTQAALLAVLALRLAAVRQVLDRRTLHGLAAQLGSVPVLMAETVARAEPAAARLARRWSDAGFFFYIARNLGLPVALEGALKMKEISYVPSDAYAAGEMKHGPIALLSDETPTIAVATGTPVVDKLASNVAEVKTRGSHVLAIASEDDARMLEYADDTIYVPTLDWRLQPILAVVPLQLLALETAQRRGLNVDQPRNLAKTVTVE